jgi:hypothetical protein
MPRRPKGAKPNITLDQIRRSVATSTAIETGESSEAIEARLKASRASAEGSSDVEVNAILGST